MSDYWQVIRRLPDGGHASICDYKTPDLARDHAVNFNAWYQTDEYAVIRRNTEKLLNSLSDFHNGSLWPKEWK